MLHLPLSCWSMSLSVESLAISALTTCSYQSKHQDTWVSLRWARKPALRKRRELSCLSPRHHYCEPERGWPRLWDNLRATHGQSWMGQGQGQGVWQPLGGKMGGQPRPCGLYLRLSLLVHPVDLAPDKHPDLAFAPSLLAVQEIGDEEGEAWQGRSPGAKRKGLRTEPSVFFHPTLPQRNSPLSGP